MTQPTQGEVREWARTRGMTVNDRGSLPASVRNAYDAALHDSSRPAEASLAAPPVEYGDLAGRLRELLDAISTEVRAVSGLSALIDSLVADLNGLRDEQAKRLVVLDQLRDSATDASLGAFLSKSIKPRKTQVPEVVPERLQ